MNLMSPPFRLFVSGDERRLGDKIRGEDKMKIFDHCPAFSRLAVHGWPWMVVIIAAQWGHVRSASLLHDSAWDGLPDCDGARWTLRGRGRKCFTPPLPSCCVGLPLSAHRAQKD